MTIRILCIHGVNTEEDGEWFKNWQKTIRNAAGDKIPESENFSFHELRYNNLFKAIPFTGEIFEKALKRLWDSYWAHRRSLGRGAEKGLGTMIDDTIGMIAKWTASDPLRVDLRNLLRQRIIDTDPHIICAHSLGSLITYDLLAEEPDLASGRLLVTLGSQIGHPAVRDVFGGYVKPIDVKPMNPKKDLINPIKPLKHWYHLFNSEDAVMACELDLPSDNFTQLDTYFDEWGPLDHSAECYLGHPTTTSNIWAGISIQQTRGLDSIDVTSSGRNKLKNQSTSAVSGNWFKKPVIHQRISKKRRALLIGINDYPQPENKLSGCVNDVFLMSALLQERGYKPEEIRIVLNDRATTQGVRERLNWLLHNVRDGDERVLFYSGHGAQITAYDAIGEPDHKDETLVTYDFDWTTNFGITDDVLASYYSLLPYGAKFSIILDCCNSGGMTRAGGAAVRGINPPDDIRHRGIAWDSSKEMWFARKEIKLKKRMENPSKAQQKRFLGEDGDTQKMGRAVGLWGNDPKQVKTEKKRLGHWGAYTPVVITACREDQFAYEYTHGVTSYGAMTYMLVQQLRDTAGAKKLEDVIIQCNRVLKSKLKFNQHADIFRHKDHVQVIFPGVLNKKITPNNRKKISNG